MSMHGEVCINRRVIGTWQARNTEVTDTDGRTVYDCDVRVNGSRSTFTVKHHRSDGATKLLALIMAESVV